jgi:hypothetical protein
MVQLGKLEMKFDFDNEEKFIDLKVHHIDPEIQFKIMELCMKAVHDQKEEEKEEEKPVILSKKLVRLKKKLKKAINYSKI